MKKKIIFLFENKKNWLSKYFQKNNFNKQIKKYDIKIKYKLSKTDKIELLFLLSYTKKFKLSYFPNIKKVFLIHESNLPNGRGFSPLKRQIIGNKSKIKCCLIECANKIDSGKIFESAYIRILKTDLYDDIRLKQFEITKKLIFRLLKKYPNIKGRKQKGSPTYYKRLVDKDDQIDIKKSLKNQFNKIRSTDYKNHQNFFYLERKKFYLRISKNKING